VLMGSPLFVANRYRGLRLYLPRKHGEHGVFACLFFMISEIVKSFIAFANSARPQPAGRHNRSPGSKSWVRSIYSNESARTAQTVSSLKGLGLQPTSIPALTCWATIVTPCGLAVCNFSRYCLIPYLPSVTISLKSAILRNCL
jgi:hypothetical protein